MLAFLVTAVIGMAGWVVAREVPQRDTDNLGSMSIQWLAEYRASHAQ